MIKELDALLIELDNAIEEEADRCSMVALEKIDTDFKLRYTRSSYHSILLNLNLNNEQIDTLNGIFKIYNHSLWFYWWTWMSWLMNEYIVRTFYKCKLIEFHFTCYDYDWMVNFAWYRNSLSSSLLQCILCYALYFLNLKVGE